MKPYLRLWPLWLFLAAEAAALAGFVFRPGLPSQPTPFSILVAALILLSGLLPALLRPASTSMLAGMLAATLAAIVVLPFSSEQMPGLFMGTPVIQSAAGYMILRLVNGAILGPLALHLAARFPLRGPISDRGLLGVYCASLGLLMALLLASLRWLRMLAALALLGWTVGLVIAAGYLLLRASRSADAANPRPAMQARLLFTSIALAVIPALLRPLGLALGVEIIPYNLFLAVQIFIPLGVAYAVLRHDLFDIDSTLRRALAYTLLSVFILAVYLALAVGLTAATARAWPEFRTLATLISLFIAALLFEPLRGRLQGLVDRMLYPDRLNFQRAVTQAQEALARVVSRNEVIQMMTVDLPPRLGAEWASLSLSPEPDLPARSRSAPAWNAQLIVGGKSLGRYWLGPRHAGPSYAADEQARLQALVGQAALALAYADTVDSIRRLNRELEARVEERTAQVLDQQRALAAYEERQRLARELHDSVTQSLFSIGLSARALRNLVRREPETAVSGLTELEQAAQQALAEMRTLLAQLRAEAPLASTGEAGEQVSDSEQDLAAQLRQLCKQLEEPGPEGAAHLLHVNLEAPASLFLPAQISHELLQIAREALHNVVKHSGLNRADARLSATCGWLRLTIRDQGSGFYPDNMPASGFGLRGIEERATALGGRLEINSAPGSGTILEVVIPTDAKSPPTELPSHT